MCEHVYVCIDVHIHVCRYVYIHVLKTGWKCIFYVQLLVKSLEGFLGVVLGCSAHLPGHFGSVNQGTLSLGKTKLGEQRC